MKIFTIASGALAAVMLLSMPTAQALNLNPAATVKPASDVFKVHSRRQVHDMLHGYGYHRVVFLSQYDPGYGKPNYRFRACMDRRAFVLEVDWYGQVISRYRDGRCHRRGHHRRYSY